MVPYLNGFPVLLSTVITIAGMKFALWSTNLGVHSAAFASGCTNFSLSGAEYPGAPALSHTLSHR